MILFPWNLNDLKTKVGDLDFGKLKTFPIDLKKLKDLVDKKVVKNIKFSTLNTKVNSFDKKISDAFISLPTSQCNTVKKIGEKNGWSRQQNSWH